VAVRVEEFLADHRGRRAIGPTTASVYRRALLAVERVADVDRLTPVAFHRLAERRGWSQSTIASYWTAVRAYSAYRFRCGLAEADPFADVRSPRRPDPNPKPVEDLDRIMALARQLAANGRADAVPIDEWVTLAAYAGLRTCEIVRVRREHLRKEPRGWVLDVPQGKAGTNASIPAHPEVVKLVQRKERGLLYPGYGPTNVQSAGRRLMRKAGLQGGLHRLRHSYATWIYQATGDPFRTQRLCRHRSLNSTLAYARVADKTLHDAIEGLYA